MTSNFNHKIQINIIMAIIIIKVYVKQCTNKNNEKLK